MEKQAIIRILKKAVKLPYRYAADLASARYIRKNMKKKNGDKIKVGFLVQMPELWDKQSGV